MNLEKVALDFVNSLVPGKFDVAKSKLSPHCKYQYGDKVLKGDAIIQCFLDNHIHAKEKLDEIEYIDGVVEASDGREVTVIVKDRLLYKGSEYIYTDRLIIGINESGFVNSINYKPFAKEQEALKKYFKENNIKYSSYELTENVFKIIYCIFVSILKKTNSLAYKD